MSSHLPGRPVRRTALALLALVALSTLPASASQGDAQSARGTATAPAGDAQVRATASGVALPATCYTVGGPNAARDLMANRYTFPPHRTVTLPHNLNWAADPLHDNNWRFQFHSLLWLLALPFAWRETGNRAYLQRALALARSWVENNPKNRPPSDMSWNDHSTALRAIALTCLARMLPAKKAWLQNALQLHAATLADPHFYRYVSNHALNQNIGLLEASCWLRRPAWTRLAQNRLNTLVAQSVDFQGASNERSVFYESYNYRRYQVAAQRLRACGRQPSAAFARIRKMPLFLALATLPNGRYLTIGDGQNVAAQPYPHTVAQYAATRGAAGPRPTTKIGVYNAGYVFGRTGWGVNRRFGDEAMFSVRFGPSEAIHGHRDGGAVTLYGYGRQLLVDPGIKDYQRDAWRAFFESPAAHNVLYLQGHAERRSWTTTLVRHRISKPAFDAQLSIGAYAGVSLHRRVVFSRRLGFLVIDDTVASSRAQRARQVWHLPSGHIIRHSGTSTWTRGAGGDVLIRQLLSTGSRVIVKGQASPRQGWLPNGWGHVTAAPVIEQAAAGRALRFLTLVVPIKTNAPLVKVSGLTTGAHSFAFVISVGSARQKVVATSGSVTITNLR